MEKLIFEEIREKLGKFNAISKVEQGSRGLERARLNARIKQIDQEINSLLQKIPQAGEADMEDINAQAILLDTEKKRLSIKAAQPEQEDAYRVNSIPGYLDNWEKVSLCDRIIVANSLIKSIIASQNKIRINWNI